MTRSTIEPTVNQREAYYPGTGGFEIPQHRTDGILDGMTNVVVRNMEDEEAFEEVRRFAESIVETIREPLLVLTRDLKIISANRSFYKTFRVAQEETVGRFFYQVGNRQWDIPKLRQLLEEIVPNNAEFNDFEVDHEFPNIGRKTMILNARQIYNAGAANHMILLAIEDITDRKKAEEALKASEKRLRYLSSQLLMAQEQERKRLARELHDGIAQCLSAIKFKMEDIIKQNGQSPVHSLTESLRFLIEMIQEGIEEVKRIQMDLRPPILDDLGILAALGWFLRQFQMIYSNIALEPVINIREEDVSGSLKTAIYRITQEAFNNIAKHSKADRVRLSLQKADHMIELSIQDNGQGFDPNGFNRGLGLSSMKERAEFSDGSFVIESALGHGTTIRASWPI
ncbi:MAG: ATP-binding protein [Thermodesulfobacteriota bacterium]